MSVAKTAKPIKKLFGSKLVWAQETMQFDGVGYWWHMPNTTE